MDDLNIIGHTKDFDEAHNHLKMKFEMKDLSKTKFCLGLQLDHLHTCILVHQSTHEVCWAYSIVGGIMGVVHDMALS
jgi:hypothetical protein